MHYVYVLRCGDDRLYVGCTGDLTQRLERHRNARAFATRERLPVRLVWYGVFRERRAAFGFEKFLKSGSGRAFMGRRLL
ncbi:GIY-YIG nuclease family protein [Candidatus Uhrbacteria bacterium]|nr:GIY-YIG nuclease family protein [Candidatus Uhrbacteria bacterium]